MARLHVFCSSTTGEKVINGLALEVRQAGREREEIRLKDLEDHLSQAVFNSSGSKNCLAAQAMFDEDYYSMALCDGIRLSRAQNCYRIGRLCF